MGMTAEQVKNLFDEYSRFNSEENRKIEGTGLGRSITKSLVEMMGGEIFVESKPDKGTSVTVRLPQERIGTQEIGVDKADDLRWFRAHRKRAVCEPMPYGSVLIVDDLESNIYVAKGLMSPYKLAIDVASSGKEVLEKVKSGSVYDIIFMDHLMPVMDGIEATKQLRAIRYTHPIIALTANAVAGQSDMFLVNGFDGFISKPIDMRQLDAVLLKFVRDKQPTAVIEAAWSSKMDSAKKNIAAAKGIIDPQLAAMFLRDAEKVLKELEKVRENAGDLTDVQIGACVFNFHAIKGALANIGEPALSGHAALLEQAGQRKNGDTIRSEIQPFLEELRRVIEWVSNANEAEEFADELTEEGREFLFQKLHAIQAACDTYDKAIIKDIMTELREKKWTRPIGEMLKNISIHLLHSEYAEITEIVNSHLLNKQG
jgi:CheY-like chemotaxis protein/HPt (histidine-containing phosphotransfer) domain-containing protein